MQWETISGNKIWRPYYLCGVNQISAGTEWVPGVTARSVWE